ncbi:unnamed protein product (macronuclear) [Paramecium tetraurelia]|uniref:Uncharacterized protein n=1 Tax=Paramecium tetraurelia TaxID=5888 RepID=A0D1H8_PARTE|nr:uncharacterized protein GSPATT00012419001 [Paramecium tetraurelia]CAK76895.1 unnamed protein product [Paramecium tetraurelia]|eukprot:XP_001444292.1 hypothetical protein (macronuclear) [Paramecium tetraurelia strain d4-2]
MKNYEQQSILVDKEFCDQNIFTYYQRSNQIHPQIRLFALQQNNIQRKLNGNANLSSIQHSMNIISIFMSPKAINQQVCPNKVLPIEKTFKENKLNSRVTQLKPPIKGLKLELSKEFQPRINQSNSLKRKICKSTLVFETPVYEDCNKHYTDQKPETFRYKDLELNSYIEEYSLLKKQTIASVKLHNGVQHQSRNENSQTSRLSIQLYSHSFKPIIKTKSISQNQQIQQKNFNISGWSDHSNK